MPLVFDRLEKDWTDRKVAILAGGPSLKGFDFERLRGFHVVAINDAILSVPWAQTVFTIDIMWQRNRTRELDEFAGEKIACVDEDFRETRAGVRYLRRARSTGLSRSMGIINTGENSGFAALGMAIMRGAPKIAMLGYDLREPGHFHQGYQWGTRYGAKNYPQWARYFATLLEPAKAQGSSILNCNPHSAIRYFPFGKPEDFA